MNLNERLKRFLQRNDKLTVHPPPSVVMSQYTCFFTPVLRYIVYTQSMFFVYGFFLNISEQLLRPLSGSTQNIKKSGNCWFLRTIEYYFKDDRKTWNVYFPSKWQIINCFSIIQNRTICAFTQGCVVFFIFV